MGVTQPDYDTFQKLAQSAKPGTLMTMYRRLMSDQLTPVLAYRRLVAPDQRLAPSFLLESVVDGQRIGRYSFLGAHPEVEIVAHGHEVSCTDHLHPQRSRRFHSEDPLQEMDKLTAGWTLAPLAAPGDQPDFVGGWFGYAGYDTVRYLEPEKLADAPPDDRHLPDLHMGLYRQMVVFDHVQKTVLVLCQVLIEEHESAEAAYAAGKGQIDAIVAQIEVQRPGTRRGEPELAVGDVDLSSPAPDLPLGNMAAGEYQKAVEKCKQYILAGDAFQIVVSQRFELKTKVDPFDMYRALRIVNPSPYMFYLQFGAGMLIGSSPEILCCVRDGVVTNRPLAGTRKRGRDKAEDQALEQQLLADPKERAEHVMLVDLGRNDVGRVAEPASIALPQIMTVERYSHVMHISSTVTGKLKAGYNCWDALRYTLPVGTVSGAPKIRAMQIIDELEPTRRGPYAGAVGHADFTGNMDMAIALRTMVVTPGPTPGSSSGDADTSPESWIVHIQAGAGIVADSVPDTEHQETISKAAALAKAVSVAEQAFGRGR